MLHSLRADTSAAVTMSMTIVRMNVARFELSPATPSLPKIAVRPAKNAERNEKSNQAGIAFTSPLSTNCSAQQAAYGLIRADAARLTFRSGSRLPPE